MKFTTGSTNRDDVRAQLVKVSVNVEGFVHFSMLRLNMSSNDRRKAVSVGTVFTKENGPFLGSSFDSLQPARNA